LLTKPNNNLGIEYCRVIYENESTIVPITFPRASGFLSASEIRKVIRSNENIHLPEESQLIINEAIKKNETASLDAYGDIIDYLLVRGINTNTPDMTDDLMNRFKNQAMKHKNISGLLAAVKTKRYTYTRLQRAVLHMALGITAGDMADCETSGGPNYIRVLGFRKKSVGLLSEMAGRATLPVITNPAKSRGLLTRLGLMMFNKEAEAAKVYALAQTSKTVKNEFSTPMVIW
jgi:predicted nucleotidyltransferase